MAGFLSLVLTILKLTVAGYWSWWRVMLPWLVFLSHNALYILIALISFRWLEDEDQEPTTADKHSQEGYAIAALLFFSLFADNLLRLMERQGWKGFWPCTGRFELVVLYLTLSLLAYVTFWARIVIGLNRDQI